MAIYYEAAVSPEDITAFTREVPIDAGRALIALFGAFETSDTNTIDFAEILHTNRAARYRTFDGRVHVSERDTGSEKRVPMLPFSNSLSKGEYERLQLEFARTAGTNVQALVTAIYNDADQLTNEMLNRLEIAIGDLLTDGRLTMSLPGEPGAEADFGVPLNQLVTVGVPWDDLTNATPLSDLLSIFDAYVANGSAEGGSMLTSRKRIRQLLRNKEIINQVKGAAAQAGRVNLAELNGILDDEGLPTLRPALDESLDVDGTTTRVLADDRVVFLPPNPEDLLKVKMGVSATALELVNSAKADFSFEDAPGIVGIVEKADGIPYRELTAVDAVGMPYLKNARRLAVLEVA